MGRSARGTRRRGKGWLALLITCVALWALWSAVLGSDESVDGAAAIPGATDPPSSETQQPSPEPAAGEQTVFRSMVDGDTIRTDLGTVRLIGIDTPERGECGYADASAAVRSLLAAGDSVTLTLPPGQRDTDRYQRLLRYVHTDDTTDLGLAQLEAGHAVARYDSTDGYPAHPREAAYHAAQLATLDETGSVVSTRCNSSGGSVRPRAGSDNLPEIAHSSSGDWWRQYPSCAALKRNTVGHPAGPFNVTVAEEAAAYEWFAHGTGNRGDGDGDGLACE